MAVSERAGNKPLIEKRSIDYIPEAERHGRLFSQFTLWMDANLQITAIVTGALAVVLGGDVFWSLIGLLIGQLLGGGVMALHAWQLTVPHPVSGAALVFDSGLQLPAWSPPRAAEVQAVLPDNGAAVPTADWQRLLARLPWHASPDAR